jgi:hypothetical protein
MDILSFGAMCRCYNEDSRLEWCNIVFEANSISLKINYERRKMHEFKIEYCRGYPKMKITFSLGHARGAA